TPLNEIQVVTAAARSCTKTSDCWFRSPAAKLSAQLWNATTDPSELIHGRKLLLFPWFVFESMLASDVTPVARSCTKTSMHTLTSFATRLVAQLVNATAEPSPARQGSLLGW